MKSTRLLCLIPTLFFATASFADNIEGVDYMRGSQQEEAGFHSAKGCFKMPCVISQKGKIRFDDELLNSHSVELGVVHDGIFSSIAIHQTASGANDRISERLFNKRNNRKVLNLESSLRDGKFNTVHIYGVLLQYTLDEGDLIVVTVKKKNDLTQQDQYYFRFHRDGVQLDVDFAVVHPIGVFWPGNSNLKGADLTGGLSLSWGWNMDPDRKYGTLNKMMHAFKLNFTTGLLNRSVVKTVNNDQTVQGQIDGYAGGGLTFMDFITAGIGINFLRSPHAAFPYVGAELGKMFDLIQSLRKSRNRQWEEYVKEEGI